MSTGKLKHINVECSTSADSLQRAKGKPLLRVPVPNRPLVFEFESEVDRDQAVDVVTPILKEAQRKGKAPVADSQRPTPGLQGPQAALKQKLLQEDRSFCFQASFLFLLVTLPSQDT